MIWNISTGERLKTLEGHRDYEYECSLVFPLVPIITVTPVPAEQARSNDCAYMDSVAACAVSEQTALRMRGVARACAQHAQCPSIVGKGSKATIRKVTKLLKVAPNL
jgi:hypothetical protein